MPDSAPETDFMLDPSINLKTRVWRVALWKEIWGCWLAAAQCEPGACPGSQEEELHCGATQHHQPAKRGDNPIVFSVGAASSSPLCAGLGPIT